MKNFTNYFAKSLFAVAALFAISSCEDVAEDVDVVVDPTPAITSVTIAEETIGDTSATVSVEFAEATTIYYSVYAADASAEAWSEVTVEETATSTSFTVEDLTAETAYSIDVYATNGDFTSETATEDFTTAEDGTVPAAPAPTVEVAYDAESELGEANFTVTVANAILYQWAYYTATEDEVDVDALEWTVVAIEADGDYTIEIADEAGDYTLLVEAVAEDEDGDGVSLVAEASLDFTIAAAAFESTYITAGALKVSTLFASLEVEINTDLCSGFCWQNSTNDEWYNADTFETYFNSGWLTGVTESGVLDLASGYTLNANTNYILDIIAYSTDADGVNTKLERISIEYSTAPVAIGTVDATLTLEANESATSVTSLGATVYNAEGIYGYYSGSVATSEITTDLQTYIETVYLTGYSAYAMSFLSYDWATSSYVEQESAELSYSSLATGTEYTIFVIAVDSDGYIGNISSVTATTTSVATDANIKPLVTSKVGSTSAEFEFDFNGCAKVFRYNAASWDNADAIYSWFLDDMATASSYGWTLDSYDVVDGKATYTVNYLSMGETYTLYYLGVDADGVLGEMQSLEYTTTTPTFDSTAAVSVTLNTGTAYYYAGEEAWPWLEMTFNVEMSDGAVEYMYSSIVESSVTNQDVLQAWGTAVFSSYYTQTSSESVTGTVTQRYSDEQVVFVPVDADGNYGMPVKYDPKTDGENGTSLWDNPVEVDLTGGGDISPMNN